ncbi:hypothetical protein SEA_CHEETODUST_80 [Mycobacterium phage CheetoDust]|nr:hypothetical protein SEA_CHEETODUST_80 [Mycobacterium phage CheetoDust]
MSARYYAQRDGADAHGPAPTYGDAMAHHVRHAMLHVGPLGDPRVLLDLGSLADADMREVLSSDPALRMVYELGRQQGVREGLWLSERR